jgi:hypothetical protein
MILKKIICQKFFISLAIFFLLAVPGGFLKADNLTNTFNNAKNVAEGIGYDQNATIDSIVGKVINALLSILGVIFIGFIVYAGFTWLTARGEADRVNTAKAILRTSIIGLIIVLAAYAISYFVLSKIASETLTGVTQE